MFLTQKAGNRFNRHMCTRSSGHAVCIHGNVGIGADLRAGDCKKLHLLVSSRVCRWKGTLSAVTAADVVLIPYVIVDATRANSFGKSIESSYTDAASICTRKNIWVHFRRTRRKSQSVLQVTNTYATSRMKMSLSACISSECTTRQQFTCNLRHNCALYANISRTVVRECFFSISYWRLKQLIYHCIEFRRFICF